MISFVPVKIESRSNLTLGFKAIIGAGLCTLTVVGLLASDSFADSRSTRSKARAIIKEHKANLKALRRLKLSPAAFAAISGASTLRDSDSDGVPDIYEEAQSTYKSCDADSDDDGTEDGDESSSSSSSSSSGSSSSSSSSGGSSSSSSSSSGSGSSSSSSSSDD